MASMNERYEDKSFLKEMGDKYVSVDRKMWGAKENGNLVVNCPQCLTETTVKFGDVARDDGHGITETAVNCGNCDFHGTIRLMGVFE